MHGIIGVVPLPRENSLFKGTNPDEKPAAQGLDKPLLGGSSLGLRLAGHPATTTDCNGNHILVVTSPRIC